MREGLVVASWGLYLPMAGGMSVCDMAGDKGARARADYDARRMGCVLQAKSPGGLLAKCSLSSEVHRRELTRVADNDLMRSEAR